MKYKVTLFLICFLLLFCFQLFPEVVQNSIAPFWRLDLFIESSIIDYNLGLTFEKSLTRNILINTNFAISILGTTDYALMALSGTVGGSYVLYGNHHSVEVKHYHDSRYQYSEYIYANNIHSLEYGLNTTLGYYDINNESWKDFSLQAVSIYAGYQFHSLYLGITQPFKHVKLRFSGELGLQDNSSIVSSTFPKDFFIQGIIEVEFWFFSTRIIYSFTNPSKFMTYFGLHYTFTNASQYKAIK